MTREDVIDELKYMLKRLPKEPPQDCDYTDEWYQTNCKMAETYNLAIKWLQSKPPVTPTRKKGRLTVDGIDHDMIDCDRTCSICGALINIYGVSKDINFCYHCGAEMERE